jgi:glycosyltransferase involved in cell wall biosynthesis
MPCDSFDQPVVTNAVMTKKRLLVFIDWYDPGYKAGGPIQSCRNLVEALRDRFDVFIVCSDRDLGDEKPYESVEVGKWTSLREGLGVYYSAPGRPTLHEIKKLVREVSPAALYVNGIFSWRYSILPVMAGRMTSTRVVVSPRGMLQEGSIRFKRTKKELFLALASFLRLYRGVHFHATDEQESRDVGAKVLKGGFIHVLPNFPMSVAGRVDQPKKEIGRLELAFVSRVSRKKNLETVLKAMALVGEGNEVRLSIAGEIDEPSYWDECKALISVLPSHASVRHLGPVPNQKLQDFYADRHLFVLPTQGENFGHAIFESLLFGRPVLISDRTPWAQLEPAKAGMALPPDAAERFAAAIERFCQMDQPEFDEWSRGARKYAERVLSEMEGVSQGYAKMFEPGNSVSAT